MFVVNMVVIEPLPLIEDKITQRTLVLENKQLTEYVGNYSYYRKRSAKPRKRQKRRQPKGKVPRRLMKKKPLRQPRRRNHQPLRP